MIYDAFIFFNELEVLEVRLHELDAVVDRFVLVEATRTHSNQPKRLYFEENKKSFGDFLHKIIHIIVEEAPPTTKPSAIADYQRDAAGRALTGCKPDDVILVSDADEIPRAERLREAAQSFSFRPGVAADLWHRLLKNRAFIWTFRNWFKRRHPFVKVFIHSSHKFFLNCVKDGPPTWPGTRMTQYRDFSTASHLHRWKGEPILDGGWHFSSMGGVERVQAKVAAFSHTEFNKPEFTERSRLAEAIEKGQDLNNPRRRNRFEQVDGTYPRYVRENLPRFKDWIRPT